MNNHGADMRLTDLLLSMEHGASGCGSSWSPWTGQVGFGGESSTVTTPSRSRSEDGGGEGGDFYSAMGIREPEQEEGNWRSGSEDSMDAGSFETCPDLAGNEQEQEEGMWGPTEHTGSVPTDGFQEPIESPQQASPESNEPASNKRFRAWSGEITESNSSNTTSHTVSASLHEAYDFYNLYSWEIGFGIRFGQSRRNANGGGIGQDIVCGCVMLACCHGEIPDMREPLRFRLPRAR